MPPEPTEPIDEATAGRIVDAMAPMLGVGIDPTWRDAVIANLQATSRAAALVLDFPLDDELEPAPVFRA